MCVFLTQRLSRIELSLMNPGLVNSQRYGNVIITLADNKVFQEPHYNANITPIYLVKIKQVYFFLKIP